MLGLTSLIHHHQPLLTFPIPPSISKFPIPTTCFFSSSFFKPKIPRTLEVVRASNGDNNLSPDSNNGGGGDEKSGSNGGDGPKKDGRPILNIRWGDLLNPDPDNIIAVGLTGLLTWASVQVVAQLFFITLAILVAALKLDGIVKCNIPFKEDVNAVGSGGENCKHYCTHSEQPLVARRSHWKSQTRKMALGLRALSSNASAYM